MRTHSLEPKSDQLPSRAMANPRGPIRPHETYIPENAGRRGLRSDRETDQWEEGEEEEIDDLDYASLNRQLALEAETQRKEAERQRKEAERQRKEAEIFSKREKTPELPLALVYGGFVVLLLAAMVAAYVAMDRPVDPGVYDDWLSKNLTASLRSMRADFPSQSEDTWLGFYAGIRRVLLDEPTQPTVFLLVHRGREAGETCACLARRAARLAGAVLQAPSPEPLLVDGGSLASYAEGRLIDTYAPLVERHGTVVLERLQLVPAEVARALHAFCDTVTPLVRKAVYVFTLDAGGGGGVAEAAQRGLSQAWGRQLGPDVLAPLVARVMGGFVLAVEAEGGGERGC